jgi:hypothetical protein
VKLEAGEIIGTIGRLERRITECLPESGLGAAVIFLVTVERRIVRHRVLRAIEELRELARVNRLSLEIWQKIVIVDAGRGV